jgi:hypothetical protein
MKAHATYDIQVSIVTYVRLYNGKEIHSPIYPFISAIKRREKCNVLTASEVPVGGDVVSNVAVSKMDKS